MEFQKQNPESSSNNSSFSSVQKKSYWKFVFWFLAIVVVAAIGYPIARGLYKDYIANKGGDYFAAEQDYLDAVRNDKYGGKTPKETYFMYLDALKKGDLVLASKYFAGVEGPPRAYKWLTRLQREGFLSQYVEHLPSDWSKMKEVEYWDKDGKEFVFDYIQEKDYTHYSPTLNETTTITAGKHQSSIIFIFNNLANIWKLYD